MAEITPPETALFTAVVGDPIAGSSIDDKGDTQLLPQCDITPPTPTPTPTIKDQERYRKIYPEIYKR